MTKLISVTDEAYERLRRLKNHDSFSKLVMRLTSRLEHRPLTEFAGKWVGDRKEMDRIFAEIARSRSHARMKEVRI